MKKQGKPWIVPPAAAIATLVLIFLSLFLGPCFPSAVSASPALHPEGARLSSEQVYTGAPQYFKDLAELQAFVDENTRLASLLDQNIYFSPLVKNMIASGPAAPAPAAGAAERSSQEAAGAQEDYSTTNIQVAGVDEADIVKSDGSYLYVRSGQKVEIVAAYPATSARVVSGINCDSQPLGLFVDGAMLVVFTQQEPVIYPMRSSSQTSGGGGVDVSGGSGQAAPMRAAPRLTAPLRASLPTS